MQATKDELYEIAGAFAKLATDPRAPSAASVYEEAEATLGNAAWQYLHEPFTCLRSATS